jgi:hypothetical protein
VWLSPFLPPSHQQTDQQGAVVMSEEERKQLLRHLKEKWATLNASYQKIGFVLDIESKVGGWVCVETGWVAKGAWGGKCWGGIGQAVCSLGGIHADAARYGGQESVECRQFVSLKFTSPASHD